MWKFCLSGTYCELTRHWIFFFLGRYWRVVQNVVGSGGFEPYLSVIYILLFPVLLLHCLVLNSHFQAVCKIICTMAYLTVPILQQWDPMLLTHAYFKERLMTGNTNLRHL